MTRLSVHGNGTPFPQARHIGAPAVLWGSTACDTIAPSLKPR
jgi:hypothetical protein